MEQSSDRAVEVGDMDPASLGVAAASLLAAKFGEGFAKDAGESTWNVVKRLQEVVEARLRKYPETDTATTTLATPLEDTAARLTAAIRIDPLFAAQVEQLIVAAQRDRATGIFVAQALDHARQINIRGDNAGTINVT